MTELRLPRDAEVQAEARSDLLGGITVLTAKGVALKESDWNGSLYRSAPPAEQAGDADGDPVLHLEQPRAEPHAGLDQRADLRECQVASPQGGGRLGWF